MRQIDRDNLKLWLETEFRAAVLDDDRIVEAGAALRVAVETGDSPEGCLRKAIAFFVRNLIDPDGQARGAAAVCSDPARAARLQELLSRTAARRPCGFDPIALGC